MDRLAGKQIKKKIPWQEFCCLSCLFVLFQLHLRSRVKFFFDNIWGWEGEEAKRGASLIVYMFKILDVLNPRRQCSGPLGMSSDVSCLLVRWIRGTLKREVGKKYWWHHPGGDLWHVSLVLIGWDWRQWYENLWKLVGLLVSHTQMTTTCLKQDGRQELTPEVICWSPHRQSDKCVPLRTHRHTTISGYVVKESLCLMEMHPIVRRRLLEYIAASVYCSGSPFETMTCIYRQKHIWWNMQMIALTYLTNVKNRKALSNCKDRLMKYKSI